MFRIIFPFGLFNKRLEFTEPMTYSELQHQLAKYGPLNHDEFVIYEG